MCPRSSSPVTSGRCSSLTKRTPTSASGSRSRSSRGRTLAGAGFTDLSRAESRLQAPELAELDRDQLLDVISVAANPDQALILLIRLVEAEASVQELFNQAEQHQIRSLIRLLGTSEALGEFLIRYPEHLDVVTGSEDAVASAPAVAGIYEPDAHGEARYAPEALRCLLLEAVGADPQQEEPVATQGGKEAAVALRVMYRRQILSITVQDLNAPDPMGAQPIISRWLADLAAAALEAALAVARFDAESKFSREEIDGTSLTVMGMGKCGARELNYLSDVDVIFVHGPAASEHVESLSEETMTAVARELATGISHTIQSPAPEPGLWEVDANLRPEGKDGELSRTVASHRTYYNRWAHTWEFQALLKCRRLAGNHRLAEEYLNAIYPLVWQVSTRPGFVSQVQSMRRRVVKNIPAKQRHRDIKLGSGGLRDIEFPVQLLQLVHGKTDSSLHVRSTEEAIQALEAGGYVGRADARSMTDYYRFLRVMEHRLQLAQMRRTHLLPEKEQHLRVLARAVGSGAQEHPHNADELLSSWKKTARAVAEVFERLFYRPLLPATAALPADQVRLSSEAAQQRLVALGYRDPKGAIRHIGFLTEGVSRSAALQRQLLPAMLGWLATGPDPDGGLLSFRRLSESISRSGWYLRMLRDSSDAAERLCTVLSSSRYVCDLLEHSPEATAWLDRDQDLVPLSLDAILTEMRSVLSRHPEVNEAMRHIRLIRRREILRTAMADALELIDQDEISHALCRADQASAMAGLDLVERELVDSGEKRLANLVVVAMGRQGGQECGYGSDLDVMFVHQPTEAATDEREAHQQAVSQAKKLTHYLKMPLKPAIPLEPVLMIDADLRPEGKQGPLVRSMESYRNYYQQWAEIWEIQALLRARTLAGEQALQDEFTDWADSVRYHTELTPQRLRAIRRMKARVESERLPRGADPNRHVKLGRGSLSDVEWLVQTFQLHYAGQAESLRTTSTMEALEALHELGHLDAHEAQALENSWRLCSRIRSANMIWSARASDTLPTNRDALEAVAQWCGYESGNAGVFEEDYLRITRHARQVFEHRFYGMN
ncbi:bifunctional [glutamine synthetase] adenylyltransferase/[glutamine synthetase]-adenylyl-L-tyrosine phosphorylase [Auritidibacter sp. NML130574]|uniref:bifunctional [glutamine synthetase] adenylyltransferase/[glutamine synthetase]-adenylyl-L-tyrosine phosphorylase n=1 Tax=Auritidibacter sp. NML130574 TaxID=2170745 RepID=UPI000D738766|nr:bifunctional [glutamine synthetase] adenylyltransferase/[glutamine synthetase]-adenylyl-L-tyrosine phosphorylase [Auritidibacter sp. NML130574]